jgi:hypothetical protein
LASSYTSTYTIGYVGFGFQVKVLAFLPTGFIFIHFRVLRQGFEDLGFKGGQILGFKGLGFKGSKISGFRVLAFTHRFSGFQ